MNTVVVPLGIQPPLRHIAPPLTSPFSQRARDMRRFVCELSRMGVCCALPGEQTNTRTHTFTHTHSERGHYDQYSSAVWVFGRIRALHFIRCRCCRCHRPLLLPVVACRFAGDDDSFVCSAPFGHGRACTHVSRMNAHWESFASSAQWPPLELSTRHATTCTVVESSCAQWRRIRITRKKNTVSGRWPLEL